MCFIRALHAVVAQPGRIEGGDYEGRVEPWECEWVWAWACGRVGGWRSWVVVDSGAAPDETQPATRAKRAETDNSDEAPIWANHGASRPRITGLFLLT